MDKLSLLTTPRSGSTWFEEVLSRLCEGRRKVVKLGAPRLLSGKSSSPAHPEQSAVRLICRDQSAQLASMFCARCRARQRPSDEDYLIHAARTEQDRSRLLTLPLEWDADIAQKCLHDLEHWNHTLNQYNARLTVTYEDLVQNPITEYQTILDTFDIPVTIQSLPKTTVKPLGSPQWLKDRFASLVASARETEKRRRARLASARFGRGPYGPLSSASDE